MRNLRRLSVRHRVEELLNIASPSPPLAEQQAIVSEVDELMALRDKLETYATATCTERRRLPEAVQHEASAQAL